MLLGHRRMKFARSAGVAPTSWDLESQAHRFEYQDRIEKLLAFTSKVHCIVDKYEKRLLQWRRTSSCNARLVEMALPAGLEPANIFVRSEAVFLLAYGSI